MGSLRRDLPLKAKTKYKTNKSNEKTRSALKRMRTSQRNSKTQLDLNGLNGDEKTFEQDDDNIVSL
jgi:hypothetical protein